MTKLIGRFAFLASFVVSVSACEGGEAAVDAGRRGAWALAAQAVVVIKSAAGDVLAGALAVGGIAGGQSLADLQLLERQHQQLRSDHG